MKQWTLNNLLPSALVLNTGSCGHVTHAVWVYSSLTTCRGMRFQHYGCSLLTDNVPHTSSLDADTRTHNGMHFVDTQEHCGLQGTPHMGHADRCVTKRLACLHQGTQRARTGRSEAAAAVELSASIVKPEPLLSHWPHVPGLGKPLLATLQRCSPAPMQLQGA